MDYLIPSSLLTLEFGRNTRLMELGYSPRDLGLSGGSTDDDHYQRALPHLTKVAEGLILKGRVTVAFVGPNYQLALLARYFGVKALGRLLDEGGIDFKQITGAVSLATSPDDTARLEADPAYRGSANADAEAAADAGLRRFAGWLAADDQRRLITAAAARTVQSRDSAPDEAVEITMLQSDEFRRAFDVPARGNQAAHIEAIRRRALDCATSLCHSMMIYDDSYALLDEKDDWTAAWEGASICSEHSPVFKVSRDVLTKENVLSIAEMLEAGRIVPEDIPELRTMPGTEAFRKWLWSEVTDGREAAAEWLSIRSGHLETARFNHARIGIMAVVKAGVSFAAKLVTGAGEGTPGALIDVVSDVLIDTAGERLLARLHERNPRNFITALERVAGRRAITSP